MTYEQFKEAVAVRAREAGLADYDLYYRRATSTTVRAYHGEIDDFSDKTSIGACFRCIADGKTGYSHTQYLSKGEAARLVADAAACAGVLDSAEFAALFEGSGEYEALEAPPETHCDVERLKEMALEIERLALEKDRRVVSVPYAYARFSRDETGLMSSRGLDLQNANSGYTVLCEAVAEADGRKYTGDAGQERLTARELDLPALVDEAVSMAVGGIGGGGVASGSYPVVFSRRMMRELLSCFCGVFSGDAAQKGLSLLAGKEGEPVASSIVTLADDPFYPDSLDKTPFDDEGVPTRAKTVVRNGVLQTLLYDMKSAAKAGVTSTGNGRRASYASDVAVEPYNFYLQAGELSFGELLSRVEGQGLFITELKGMHASANAATGDFSLEAKGFLIEDGQLSRPAEQFTIAGNFYTLLREITALADDFLLEGGFGAPSALVSSLAIAGS